MLGKGKTFTVPNSRDIFFEAPEKEPKARTDLRLLHVFSLDLQLFEYSSC